MLFLLQACGNSKSLKANKLIKAIDILKQIEKGEDVFYQDISIEGDLDLSSLNCKYQESELTKKVSIAGSVTFINCKFLGSILGFKISESEIIACHFQKNLSLINCTIEGEFDLREASYVANVQLKKSAFKKAVRMEGSHFYSNAIFNNCIFLGESSFQNSFFNWKTNFMETEFAKNCAFQGSTFNGIAQFSSIRCSAYADFTLLNFQQAAFFSYANFDDRVAFGGSKFRDRVDFIKSEFTMANFGNVLFQGDARFNNIGIYSSLDMKEAVFYGAVPSFTFKEVGMEEKLALEAVRYISFENLKGK